MGESEFFLVLTHLKPLLVLLFLYFESVSHYFYIEEEEEYINSKEKKKNYKDGNRKSLTHDSFGGSNRRKPSNGAGSSPSQ